MLISTKGRYALMIMTYIASNSHGRAVSLKDIADNNQMGIKYLEIIVSSLNRAGLLESVRGKNGGYRLKKHPAEYTVLEILLAAEGCLIPVSCVEEGFCENADNCSTHKMWLDLNRVINEFFSERTLADII